MYLGNLVEVLPGKDLDMKAMHPYTRALMGAVFDINMDFSKPIESIESEAPSPLDLPQGCPFREDVNIAWISVKRRIHIL